MPRLPSLLFLCAVFALVLPLPALAGPLETAIAERMGAPLGAEVTEEESADIAALAAEKAMPWSAHSCFGAGGARFQPGDASFRHQYGEG